MITLTGSHSTGIGFVFENLVTIPGGEMGGMSCMHTTSFVCLFITFYTCTTRVLPKNIIRLS